MLRFHLPSYIFQMAVFSAFWKAFKNNSVQLPRLFWFAFLVNFFGCRKKHYLDGLMKGCFGFSSRAYNHAIVRVGRRFIQKTWKKVVSLLEKFPLQIILNKFWKIFLEPNNFWKIVKIVEQVSCFSKQIQVLMVSWWCA